MPAPVIYKPDFVPDPDGVFKRLHDELNWLRVGNTPRSEYYCNKVLVPYTYGSGRGVRTYEPQPWHPDIEAIRDRLKAETGVTFDTCFLNRYLDQRDQLGWHSDDSPEMDDDRPIAIVSFGVAREIWFAPKTDGGTEKDVLKLGHGSLALMAAGMQDTHKHRIPKAGFTCGERISLTYRGFVSAP
jgi:alkylated DNA repair dioxygenase AlkB